MSVTEGLAQLSALVAAPLLLILLLYFSGKALRSFSPSSSKKKRERDGTEQLLQLLVLSELLDTHQEEASSTNSLPSIKDQEA